MMAGVLEAPARQLPAEFQAEKRTRSCSLQAATRKRPGKHARVCRRILPGRLRSSASKATAISIVVFIFFGSYSFAQRPPVNPLSWDQNVRGIVTRFCIECHSSADPSADVDLEQDVDLRQILNHRETWSKALELIKSGEMPPKEAERLFDNKEANEKRDELVAFLEKHLNSLDCETLRDPGKPLMRRLNRVEYDLAVQDLTGLKLALADGFSPDESSYGFDNNGEALSLSPAQTEQYHSAAVKIVQELRKQKDKQPRLFELSFGKSPSSEEEAESAARKAARGFATRAFRRPVEGDFVERLMDIYRLSRAKGEDHETAQGHLVTAVLISPQFLFRLEKNRPETNDPYPIDDYELASRLSFFLWSRPPDKALLDAASKGELSKDDVLEAATRRMLTDQRSQALVDNFFGQWLSLRELEDHQPDQSRFPQFNANLRSAMGEEVRLFLSELVRQDRSILELIDSDFTYLNETLAKHYGIEGVRGKDFKRVSLNDRRRGGLLTSAALLMLQSDPNRTNVPRRGNFVAGRILGTPPPPPPPNVPDLAEVEADGKARPLRELLELHRKNPECANCHAKMDPYGLALENYDAVGRWRTKDGEFKIDAASKLLDGSEIDGPESLKDWLLKQKNKFRRNFVKNLLIYAFGRGLQGNDECVIREVIAASDKHDDRFASIVVAIVKSYPFRHRRNPVE